MAPKNERELMELAREAMSLSPDARRDFLRSRCNGDDELRRRVEGLLLQADSATLMDGATTGPSVPRPAAPARPVESSHNDGSSIGRIGAYQLMRVLGEGGMGVVYLAEQDRPRRVVALKVVRPGLITPTLLRRFEHEAEVLARLQHPGIASIFEAGTAVTIAGAAPTPFFAMEHVEGEPLTSFAASRELSRRERLRLMIRVCDAVQHAHAKGVIHRDLKPGNILVTADGQPKVLDFGIARVADEAGGATLQTEAGQIIGTLPYMSPEQISGRVQDIDTRTDVYALGVVLFELLTGRRPHALDGKTIADAARTVELNEPTKLGSIDRTLRGDLETIAAKALAPERERRYQSASELAADLSRYLNDEPVLARPPSRVYQITKFAQRNRDLVAGLVVAFFILIAGIIGTSRMAYQATLGREAAEKAQREADEARAHAEMEADNAKSILKYVDTMFSSISPDRALGREVTVREVLDETAGRLDEAFENRPRVEASIRQTLSGTYRALARYDEAEIHAKEAWGKLRGTLGDEDLETINAKRRYAAILIDRGSYTEAEKLLTEAIAVMEAKLGADDPEVGAALGEYGRIYQMTGRMKEAEEAIRKSLAICRPVLGDQDTNVMIAMHNLASCLKDQGRHEEAESAFREILDVRIKRFGEEHPETAYTLNNLAACLSRMGKNEEAIGLLARALKIRRAVLGNDHPSTLVSLTNYAGALIATGRITEAEPLVKESVEANGTKLGESDSRTLIAMNNLAYLQEELNKLDEAEATYRRIVAIREKATNALDPETWITMNNLATLLQKRGKLEEADGIFRNVMSLSAPLADSVPHLVAIFRNNHGDCLVDMKRYEDAEKELLASLPVLEAKFGAEHARVAKAKGRLVRLYEAWERPDDAAKYRP